MAEIDRSGLRAGAVLPRRDPDARAALREIAAPARPAVWSRDRVVPLRGPLGVLLPEGGMARGATITLGGGPGVTSAMLLLAAATTAVGEWAAVVDADASLGGLAALEAGIVPERFAVVRDVPVPRWATVVGTLLEGVSTVVATAPAHLRPADARRLSARARAHDAVLVVLGAWPGEAQHRITLEGMSWEGLDAGGGGLLRPPELRVRLEGREVAGLTGAVAVA